MIRFRHEEDERRYLKLRSEVYRLLATHVPAPLVSSVLRNIAKLDQLIHLEGVRQGLAVAEISELSEDMQKSGVRHLKAFQAHAVIYGSTDTPLTSVENEWLEKLNVPPATRPWLDELPMRYAPQTLEEWENEEPTPPVFDRLEDVIKRVEEEPRSRSDRVIAKARAEMEKDGVAISDCMICNGTRRVLVPETLQQYPGQSVQCNDCGGYGFVPNPHRAPDFGVPAQDATSHPPVMEPRHDPDESPAFLDEVRNRLQTLMKAGWHPDDWGQLVLRLHQEMKVDAGYLDIQLSTDFGRAMLDQCGLFELHPGHGIVLSDMKTR